MSARSHWLASGRCRVSGSGTSAPGRARSASSGCARTPRARPWRSSHGRTAPSGSRGTPPRWACLASESWRIARRTPSPACPHRARSWSAGEPRPPGCWRPAGQRWRTAGGWWPTPSRSRARRCWPAGSRASVAGRGGSVVSGAGRRVRARRWRAGANGCPGGRAGRLLHRVEARDARDHLVGDQVMTVHFIGAGPGAADLITVRAARIIASAPVCLYAGALVPRELVDTAPAGARLVATADLDLYRITAELVAAHAAGLDVARLHSGAPSIYSAVAEQMRRLDAAGVPYD